MVPLLTNLSQKCPRSHSPSPYALHAPITPVRRARDTLPLSPLPGAGLELRACLSDFAESTGIDIMDCEDTLMVLELTPDIIPDVPAIRLCEVTCVVEGRVRKFQAYCKIWNTGFDAKKVELNGKRRRVD
jgi:hypothetical protein